MGRYGTEVYGLSMMFALIFRVSVRLNRLLSVYQDIKKETRINLMFMQVSIGAGGRTRTPDLLITNQIFCLFSSAYIRKNRLKYSIFSF